MRLKKRDRLTRKAVKRLRRVLKRRQAKETNGMVSLTHNSLVSRKGYMAMPIGSVNPGGNIFKPEGKEQRPTYVIEREPRLSSKPSASLKRQTVKQRFANI